MINSVLDTVRQVVDDSLVGVLWNLNGWDDELRPEVGTSAVDHKDVYKLAAAHRDMASAGAMLTKFDPAYRDFLAMVGTEHPDEMDDPLLMPPEADPMMMPDEQMPNEPAAAPMEKARREVIVVSPRLLAGKGKRFSSDGLDRQRVAA